MLEKLRRNSFAASCKLRIRHAQRDAGFQACHDVEVHGVVGTGGVDLERQPSVGWRVKLGRESGTGDSHDSIGHGAERDGFAGHLRVARKAALPQYVAEDGYVGDVGPIFAGSEGAADRDGRAEQAEIIGRDANSVDLFRICAAGEVEAGPAILVGGDIPEGGGLAAQHVELGGRGAVVGAGGRGLEEENDAVGGGVCQGLQQDGVDD